MDSPRLIQDCTIVVWADFYNLRCFILGKHYICPCTFEFIGSVSEVENTRPQSLRIRKAVKKAREYVSTTLNIQRNIHYGRYVITRRMEMSTRTVLQTERGRYRVSASVVGSLQYLARS